MHVPNAHVACSLHSESITPHVPVTSIYLSAPMGWGGGNEISIYVALDSLPNNIMLCIWY